MKVSDVLRSAAWAAAGAALVGGGMVLGFASARLRRKEGSAQENPVDLERSRWKRIEELAGAVADLRQRVNEMNGVQARDALECPEAVHSRLEQLEQQVARLATDAAPAPAVDQVLGAVEQMVATRIGSLDERLSDQVYAIETLRDASAQTDALLRRVIHAVESLAGHSAERAETSDLRSEGGSSLSRDHPAA